VELRQLRHFVTVAETLSFRGAAERLQMTQPPLSVSIRKLEDEIGTALFVRDTQTTRLTRAGEAALAAARAALFHAEETTRIARATAHGAMGQLRVGFVGSAKNALLPRLLPAFGQMYPQVVLRFTEQNNTWLVAAVERGDLDVAVVRVPLARRSSVRYETVERDVFVLALPAGHRLADRERVPLTALADEPLIDYTADAMPGLHALSTMLLGAAGVSPRVAQEAMQVETVLFLVESGLGVALVPSSSRRRAGRGVVFRPLDPEPARHAIGLALAYAPERDSVLVRHFRELAVRLRDVDPGGSAVRP
jgi:DNA-binding transcriptional LysR family regulator